MSITALQFILQIRNGKGQMPKGLVRSPCPDDFLLPDPYSLPIAPSNTSTTVPYLLVGEEAGTTAYSTAMGRSSWLGIPPVPPVPPVPNQSPPR